MDNARHDKPISDVMRTPGDEKYRVLATSGAATFLMLDGGAAASKDRRPRSVPEDAALAAAAEEIHDGLTAAEREDWPGGRALALQMLAERAFYPPVEGRMSGPDGYGVFRALAEGRYVRVVNFHATPPWMAGDLQQQLARLARGFAPVSHEDLLRFVGGGGWPHDRPGVMINFFDGHRDNHDVAAPILDRLGLTGWFFLVPGWISTRPEDQRAFAADHDLALSPYEGLPDDDRLALSPDEVRDLASRGHVIASHTLNHAPIPPKGLTPKELLREAEESKRQLEAFSGTVVSTLAWYAGLPLGESAAADAALRDAGYELLLANHAVQRVARRSA